MERRFETRLSDSGELKCGPTTNFVEARTTCINYGRWNLLTQVQDADTGEVVMKYRFHPHFFQVADWVKQLA